MQVLTGEISDISIMNFFTFYEELYFSIDDPTILSDTSEELGYFVGFAKSVGDAMTFKVLNKIT
jgi:hypothetical protein